ncbi:RNA polymerase sigma factor [Pseudoxanthomonas sp. CAU 1598]|uniref:RNA polymerase sigma factor n=2 Tax=Pseudomarimonas arenosa TaxID=2774145 RepID=A0AAW3ZRG9_9GAMM|nr:RNA polymerase sigma factor [Pseudomarimonas arenosa]
MTAENSAVDSLEQFLRSVERRALRHVELSCRDHEDALDVVQETMLAFVKRYRDKPADQWPLLFWRVLDSKLVDLYRKRSLRGRWFGWLGMAEEDSTTDPLQQVADPIEPGPLSRLSDQQATEALLQALRQLPLRQRQAFLLRVWEGLDVQQTASAMAVSEGSVKTHLFRALQVLRGRLEKHL